MKTLKKKRNQKKLIKRILTSTQSTNVNKQKSCVKKEKLTKAI